MNESKKVVESTEEDAAKETIDTEESESTKKIREAAEDMMQKIRNKALIHGARMTASVILQAINKHLNKQGDISRRDLERCVNEISTFATGILKQTEDNDTEEEKLSDD